jgi:nicotinamide-nucleotide amidase
MSDLVVALADRVLQKAQAAGVTRTVGRLATLLADAPGGGEQFHGGFVTYTKENKIATLGVPRELIAMYAALALAVTMLDEIGASRAGKGKRT